MRILTSLLILAAACGPAAQSGTTAAAPAPAQAAAPAPLAGSYALRQINGHDLPAASPTEPNVQLSGGMLQLDPAGTFVITLTGRRNQEPTPGDEHMRGTYTASGDVLAMSGPGVPDGMRFTFARSGAMLTLHDDQGNTWTLERQ